MENNKQFVIERVTEFSSEMAEAVRSLIQQLDNNYYSLSDENIKEMLQSTCNRLIVSRELDTGKVVGMLTLLIYRIPYTKKAMIEDVVVDKEFRHHGIGASLINHALALARQEHVAYIDLTSRPTRVGAGEFYQKLGFKKRETNVYRFVL